VKKGEISRGKLVETAAELFRRQGYHATGLAQIVEESGAPRGSLYFYFPGGKEELACAALDLAGAAWRGKLDAVVARAEGAGAAAEAVCRFLASELTESRYECGCPLMTVALEASSSSEIVRERCAAHFAGWEEAIARRLLAAGGDEGAARAVASFVLGAVEGASMLARVRRDPAPLLQAGAILRGMVERAGLGSGKG
jgi:TetR/AcrR family transcriptional repressor of lmrAB and yxaGH operons